MANNGYSDIEKNVLLWYVLNQGIIPDKNSKSIQGNPR